MVCPLGVKVGSASRAVVLITGPMLKGPESFWGAAGDTARRFDKTNVIAVRGFGFMFDS